MKIIQEPENSPFESPEVSIPKANVPGVRDKEEEEKLMTEKESKAEVDVNLTYLIKPTMEGNLEARKGDGDEDNAWTKPSLQHTLEPPNSISKFLEDVSNTNRAIEGEKEDKEKLEKMLKCESKVEGLKGLNKPVTEGNIEAEKDVADGANVVGELSEAVESEKEYKEKLKIDKEIEGKVEPTTEQNLETIKDVGVEVAAVSKPNEPIDSEKENKEKLKTNKVSESIVEESRDLKPSIEGKLETKKDVGGEVTAKPNVSIDGEKEDNDKLKTKQESESLVEDLRNLKPSIEDKSETEKDGGGEDNFFYSQNLFIFDYHTLNISMYIYATGGMLQAIKYVADKVVAPFKSNEEIESGNGENEKLKTEKESEGKVEGSTKPTVEGKVDVEVEVATSKSNDAVVSEKEGKLNTKKKSQGKVEDLMCMTSQI